ncbi:MAG: aminopeptidase P N-terminal domain-containing protein [Gammaproteobacteria bacterium]
MAIGSAEYMKRRRQLMRMMGENAIAIVPGAREKIRNRDTHFPFRQDSDFHYLTGFPEADAVAVFVPGRKTAEYILFCRDRDPTMETWNGKRAGPEGACEEYAADDAFPIDDIDEILPGLMEGRERVFYTLGSELEFDHRVINWVHRLRAEVAAYVHTPQEFITLDHYLHDLRLYKSRAELACMRKAAKISIAAHRRVMHACRPGKFEYEIEAEITHQFRASNAHHAYPPIVGSGANSCVLHYVDNSGPLQDGDLLLVDTGCEVDYYASDVTRTLPVNGRFSAPQRALYEIVLAAQLAAIEKAVPGNHWNDVHDAARRSIVRGLIELGILKGSLAQLLKKQAERQFFMHRTGHWLGLDVHDVGDYKIGDEWRELEPGMVMTVEPGIYIPARTRGVNRKWWNMGIRIEDDVLVTKNGPEVLSGGLEKTPADIEALMQVI